MKFPYLLEGVNWQIIQHRTRNYRVAAIRKPQFAVMFFHLESSLQRLKQFGLLAMTAFITPQSYKS